MFSSLCTYNKSSRCENCCACEAFPQRTVRAQNSGGLVTILWAATGYSSERERKNRRREKKSASLHHISHASGCCNRSLLSIPAIIGSTTYHTSLLHWPSHRFSMIQPCVVSHPLCYPPAQDSCRDELWRRGLGPRNIKSSRAHKMFTEGGEKKEKAEAEQVWILAF